MGVTPLTNAQLSTEPPHRGETIPIVGNNGTSVANVVEVPASSTRRTQNLKELFADPGWNGEAPLWFYILKEAEIVGTGRELGPVGGRIVAEVLVGLLQKDPNSYLYLQPTWKPPLPIAPGQAASSRWPISSSTRGSGPNKRGARACERQGADMQESIVKKSPRGGIARRVGSSRDGPGRGTDAGSLQGDRRGIHR